MPIRVLIADDDPLGRETLVQIIGNAADMMAIGFATNGQQAVQMTKGMRPDVIVMDAFIPHMAAIEAIREIMDVNPVPIVMVCAPAAQQEPAVALESVKAGALAVLAKPDVASLPDYQAASKELVNTIRAMSVVHVIRHPRTGRTPSDISKITTYVPHNSRPDIVSIVASTGGPQTLSEIIKPLPVSFKLPIVIVQHITPDFVMTLVRWLNSVSQLPVQVARSGDYPEAGHIYIAPGNIHLRLTNKHQFDLSVSPSNVPHIPSGDIFLESVARNYGSRAVGVVLTGMGNDGAQGLRAMYDVGAVTVAQDRDSCVVFGMPQEAIALGAARHTLNPGEISKLLGEYAR